MTKLEYRILGRVATQITALHPSRWQELRYQTQFGPESHLFPYFPAALELQPIATEAVHALGRGEKASLLREWRSQSSRDIDGPPEAVLDRQGTMVLELIINRAHAAGRRVY